MPWGVRSNGKQGQRVNRHSQPVTTPAAPRLGVDLVTGFLGSGKTTLINSLLRNPAFAGTLVVVNEFGKVGLDHLLVSSAEDQVVLLDSGCLCCAASGSLRDTLIDMFARRNAGTIPAFDRIVVETSGLADPAPLIATVLGDSALVTRCQLSQVLTLVDAANGLDTLERHTEAQRQIALADRLLITKTDTATPAGVAALARQLDTLNPLALRGTWQRDDPPAALFEPLPPGMAAGGNKPAVSAGGWRRGPWRSQYGSQVLAESARDLMPAGTPERGSHGERFSRITTESFALHGPVSWAQYAEWTQQLVRQFGKRLLRCKGLLALGDGESADTPWVVQGVQGYFAPPERITHWPGPPGQGFLVCIGESLQRAELAELLQHPASSSF